MCHRPILLVEDSPDDVELTRYALQAAGYRHALVVASDGPEALDRLFGPNASDPAPGLVLLDLKLPKMGGIEVITRVRAHETTRWLPVVVLTTSTEEQDVVAAYRAGANSFVRKPVNFDEFKDVVGQLCRYWLGLNTPPRHA